MCEKKIFFQHKENNRCKPNVKQYLLDQVKLGCLIDFISNNYLGNTPEAVRYM